MKLEYDEPLSNVAFNFNLRRFRKEGGAGGDGAAGAGGDEAAAAAASTGSSNTTTANVSLRGFCYQALGQLAVRQPDLVTGSPVGRCRLTEYETHVQSAWN